MRAIWSLEGVYERHGPGKECASDIALGRSVRARESVPHARRREGERGRVLVGERGTGREVGGKREEGARERGKEGEKGSLLWL